jgi:hypothetical protein
LPFKLPAGEPETLLHDRLNGNPAANMRRGLIAAKLIKMNMLCPIRYCQNGTYHRDVGISDIDCRIFRQPHLDRGYADQRARRKSMAICAIRGE